MSANTTKSKFLINFEKKYIRKEPPPTLMDNYEEAAANPMNFMQSFISSMIISRTYVRLAFPDNILISRYVGYALETNGKKHNYKIVSVGSGNGSMEFKLCEKLNFPIENMICVDPEPESYKEYPTDQKYLPPSYKTVSELIHDQKDLIGTCGVFINWSYPNMIHESKSTYWDLEAISLLNPEWIVVVYAKCGAAGSFALHKFLNKYGAPNDTKIYANLQENVTAGLDYKTSDYNTMHHHTIWERTGVDIKTCTAALLVRKKCRSLPKWYLKNNLPFDHEITHSGEQ